MRRGHVTSVITLATAERGGADPVRHAGTRGWGYVGFEAYELQEGQQLTLPAVSEERCLVLVAGRASISTPSAQFNDIGERMSPFERIKPWAVYVTRRRRSR